MSVIFKNPATEAKIQLFFLFAPKDPFGELFLKITFKSSSEFLFWQKIRKFEIGQNVPNFQNVYWAFSTFSFSQPQIFVKFVEIKMETDKRVSC